MKYILLFSLLIGATCAVAQKPQGFFVKLHQFRYPTNPLPVGCMYYGVKANVAHKSIQMKDYRGEVLSLHTLKVLWGGYDPSVAGWRPKMATFERGNSPIPAESGFLFEFNIGKIEVTHHQQKPGIYALKYHLKLHASVTYKEKVIHKDSLIESKIFYSFPSDLSGKDAHIVATAQARDQAIVLNDLILSKAMSYFKSYAYNRFDLRFEPDFVKFYGLSKSKKLKEHKQIVAIRTRLKNLKKLDELVQDRSAFLAEIDSLIQILQSINQENPGNVAGYSFFIHANLGGLYALKEEYGLAVTHYENALGFTDKERFKGDMGNELRKAKQRARGRLILFPDGSRFDKNYSSRYLQYWTNREHQYY